MKFRESLMEDLQKAIIYRTALGFNVGEYSHTLPRFIEFCADNYPNGTSITRQMVDEWMAAYPFRTNRSRTVFISTLRQFSRFIQALGKESFVPDGDYSYKQEPYKPYVFSDTELAELFHAIDSYQPYYCYRKFRADIICPVLFRMMYCCGMRPTEPLKLRVEDVDLRTGDIYIQRAKYAKDRHIIMSADLLELCRHYDLLIGKREWFFPHPNGGPLSRNWMGTQFEICWRESGLKSDRKPRPYDLRHAFATRVMTSWMDDGNDIMTLMPFLSTYLGHVEFSSTLHYIHLLPARIRESSGVDWGMLQSVYAEADYE